MPSINDLHLARKAGVPEKAAEQMVREARDSRDYRIPSIRDWRTGRDWRTSQSKNAVNPRNFED